MIITAVLHSGFVLFKFHVEVPGRRVAVNELRTTMRPRRIWQIHVPVFAFVEPPGEKLLDQFY